MEAQGGPLPEEPADWGEPHEPETEGIAGSSGALGAAAPGVPMQVEGGPTRTEDEVALELGIAESLRETEESRKRGAEAVEAEGSGAPGAAAVGGASSASGAAGSAFEAKTRSAKKRRGHACLSVASAVAPNPSG